MTRKFISHCICYSLLLILFSAPSNSQQIPSVPLNSSVVGTNKNASVGLFTNFKRLDIRKRPVGLRGQRLFQLQIPTELAETHITISTCAGSNFDTYIALLDGNPQVQEDVTALSESGNDINCQTGRNKAFISTNLPPRLYFILITGHADQEGIFNISVTGASVTPPPVPWGLDRVDQRRLPLDGKYDVRPSGGRVWIYLIDSGVRTTHKEFEGRAQQGYDFVNNKEASAPDCTGHGTHVAGIIAGKTYGVSKQARIVSVRAFDCNNTARVSSIVDSLGWALVDARFKERRNVIIAMMFSTTAFQSSTLQSAIRGVQRSGIPVVIPAGNNGRDACEFYPGSLGLFLTVGSTGRDDARSQFSNFGNCTKIYAPGDSIVSSWHNSDNSWRSFSGTAQAAAHVTGVVSSLMNLNPVLKSEMIYNIIASVSTLDVVGNIADGESTRLAFVRSVPEFTGSTPPPEKEVYVFVILRFKILDCSEETEEIASIKGVFAEELGVKASRIRLTCSSDKGLRSSADTRLIQLRFQLAERTAVADFMILEKLLFLGKAALEQKFGLPFDVIEEPWVVDSTLTVFWGVPTFSETESNSLSSGAVAGIVVGVLFLVCIIIVMCTWLAYRRYAKLDVIESMEGSGDFEKQPATFKDFENSGSQVTMRSFRNVIRHSKSFRKPGGGRRSTVEPVDEGLNRMGSFLGGPREKVGRDIVRLESFGGEVFAGFTSVLRKSSPQVMEAFKQKSKKPDHRASFRGANNLVIEPKVSTKEGSVGHSDFNEADERELDGALQMRSLGAEAFAMIGLHERLDSGDSSRSCVEDTSTTAALVNMESYEREALAETEVDRASDNGMSEHGSSGSSSRTSSFFNLQSLP